MIGNNNTVAQKKVKMMQKPTINLSINNNVQNVIVTPIGQGYNGHSGAHTGQANSNG
jgi:hypothetical protein